MTEAWQHRAVRATGGNTTRLGCMVLAVLGWQHGRHPPRFGSTCWITGDGIVVANFQNARGTVFVNQALCTVQETIDNFRGLADHLELDDAERQEMFVGVRKWVAKDLRATSTLE